MMAKAERLHFLRILGLPFEHLEVQNGKGINAIDNCI